MKWFTFAFISIVILVSCTTHSFVLKERVPIQVNDLSGGRVFHIKVIYFNQNDFGLTDSVDEIESRVRCYTLNDNEKKYYQWFDYKTRSYKVDPKENKILIDTSLVDTEWKEYYPAIGFEYLMKGTAIDENGELSNLPNVDSIPRDQTGFRFYINIIDFHSWDIYIDTFINNKIPAKPSIKKIGDIYNIDLSSQKLPLLAWEDLTSDLHMEGGSLYGEYLSDVVINDKTYKIIYYKQDQRICQNVYGKAGIITLKMPYDGTTRFYGYIYVDKDNQLLKATLTEYVYGKVTVPVLSPVIVHNTREYLIEREE